MEFKIGDRVAFLDEYRPEGERLREGVIKELCPSAGVGIVQADNGDVVKTKIKYFTLLDDEPDDEDDDADQEDDADFDWNSAHNTLESLKKLLSKFIVESYYPEGYKNEVTITLYDFIQACGKCGGAVMASDSDCTLLGKFQEELISEIFHE